MSSEARRGNLFIISAPSGAGKTSLVHGLLERVPSLELSVSHTTRPQRSSEQAGVHYHFVTKEEFERKVEEGRFLEYARVFDHLYGTSYAAIAERLDTGMDVILEIDWQGAQQVRKQLPEARSIFILPPSRTELERRLGKRAQDSNAVITRRMRDAQAEISHYHEYEYLVVNDNFAQALEELRCIILAERLKRAKQEFNLARLLLELDASPEED